MSTHTVVNKKEADDPSAGVEEKGGEAQTKSIEKNKSTSSNTISTVGFIVVREISKLHRNYFGEFNNLIVSSGQVLISIYNNTTNTNSSAAA